MKNHFAFIPLFIAGLYASPVVHEVHNPRGLLAKRNVNVVIDHEDQGIVGEDGNAVNVQLALQTEFNVAAQLAEVAAAALNDPAITQHPAYLTIFGRQRSPSAAVAHLIEMYQRVSELFSPSNGREIHVQAFSTPPTNTAPGERVEASVNDDDVFSLFEPFWADTAPIVTLSPTQVNPNWLLGPQLRLMSQYRAIILLHELFHTSFIDIEGQMLHTETTPPEVSGGDSVLAMAASDPEHAVFNPESLALFAMSIYFGIWDPEPDDLSAWTMPVNSPIVVDSAWFDPVADINPPLAAEWFWGAIHGNAGSSSGSGSSGL